MHIHLFLNLLLAEVCQPKTPSSPRRCVSFQLSPIKRICKRKMLKTIPSYTYINSLHNHNTIAIAPTKIAVRRPIEPLTRTPAPANGVGVLAAGYVTSPPAAVVGVL